MVYDSGPGMNRYTWHNNFLFGYLLKALFQSRTLAYPPAILSHPLPTTLPRQMIQTSSLFRNILQAPCCILNTLFQRHILELKHLSGARIVVLWPVRLAFASAQVGRQVVFVLGELVADYLRNLFAAELAGCYEEALAPSFR